MNQPPPISSPAMRWDDPIEMAGGALRLPYGVLSLLTLPPHVARQTIQEREALYYTQEYSPRFRALVSRPGVHGRCMRVTDDRVRWSVWQRCANCQGRGLSAQWTDRACPICDGMGWHPTIETVDTDLAVSAILDDERVAA